MYRNPHRHAIKINFKSPLIRKREKRDCKSEFGLRKGKEEIL